MNNLIISDISLNSVTISWAPKNSYTFTDLKFNTSYDFTLSNLNINIITKKYNKVNGAQYYFEVTYLNNNIFLEWYPNNFDSYEISLQSNNSIILNNQKVTTNKLFIRNIDKKSNLTGNLTTSNFVSKIFIPKLY